MIEKRPELKALTGLRFFAALWVVCGHLAVHWRPGLLGTGTVAAIATSCQLAVYLFWVLSGFVLGYSYVQDGGSLRGTARAFYVGRVARLYPLYLVSLLLAMAPHFLWHDDLSGAMCQSAYGPAASLAAAVPLLQMWVPGVSTCINSPAWSLSVEAGFYAIFPLIVPLMGRIPRSRVLLVLLACCTFYVLICEGAGATLPLSAVPVFVAGVLLARVSAAHMARVACIPTTVLIAATALIASWEVIPLPVRSALLLPVYLLLLARLASGRGLAARLLSLAPLVALGEASYALYILHWPLLEWYSHLSGVPFGLAAAGDVYAPLRAVVYVTLVIGMALAARAFIEVPMQRRIRQKWAASNQRFTGRSVSAGLARLWAAGLAHR